MHKGGCGEKSESRDVSGREPMCNLLDVLFGFRTLVMFATAIFLRVVCKWNQPVELTAGPDEASSFNFFEFPKNLENLNLLSRKIQLQLSNLPDIHNSKYLESVHVRTYSYPEI